MPGKKTVAVITRSAVSQTTTEVDAANYEPTMYDVSLSYIAGQL